MAWVRPYFAPNLVGARKLKALIFCTINPPLNENGHFAFLSPSLGGLGTTYAVHLRLVGKRVVDFLLVITSAAVARGYGSAQKYINCHVIHMQSLCFIHGIRLPLASH